MLPWQVSDGRSRMAGGRGLFSEDSCGGAVCALVSLLLAVQAFPHFSTVTSGL